MYLPKTDLIVISCGRVIRVNCQPAEKIVSHYLG